MPSKCKAKSSALINSLGNVKFISSRLSELTASKPCLSYVIMAYDDIIRVLAADPPESVHML